MVSVGHRAQDDRHSVMGSNGALSLALVDHHQPAPFFVITFTETSNVFCLGYIVHYSVRHYLRLPSEINLKTFHQKFRVNAVCPVLLAGKDVFFVPQLFDLLFRRFLGFFSWFLCELLLLPSDLPSYVPNLSYFYLLYLGNGDYLASD